MTSGMEDKVACILIAQPATRHASTTAAFVRAAATTAAVAMDSTAMCSKAKVASISIKGATRQHTDMREVFRPLGSTAVRVERRTMQVKRLTSLLQFP